MLRVCKNLGFHGVVEDPGVLWDVMLRYRIIFLDFWKVPIAVILKGCGFQEECRMWDTDK